MIEQGIYQLLVADPAYSALLGTCLYPVVLPDNPTYPCATFQVVSAGSQTNLDATVGEFWKRIQFDQWAFTYAETKALQLALNNALGGFIGTLPDGTQILGSFRGVEIDQYEQFSRTYRALTEYVFHYFEPTT